MEEKKKSNEKGKIALSSSERVRRRRRSEETMLNKKRRYVERESKRRRRDVFMNNDVLEEIMVRLPVKTLIQFQTVSKNWRGMITSRSLKERYSLHQKTKEPKFLCVYEDRNYFVENIALKTMRLEWSSTCLVEEEDEEYHTRLTSNEVKKVLVSKSLDGLFFLLRYGGDMIRPINVINPSTRRSWTLPLAKIQLEEKNTKVLDFPRPGFGKDYVTGTYKLVWLHNNTTSSSSSSSSSCEVFDFGAKQWRPVIAPIPPHQRIEDDQVPIFANGWLYWFSQDKTKLVAFDLHMEVFRIVPNPASPSSVDVHMERVDDDRGLVWMSETNRDGLQHVWKLTNYNTRGTLLIMDKMFTFDLNKFTITWFDYSFLKVIAISKKGDKVMLLRSHSQKLLLFQPPNPTFHFFTYSHPPPSDCILRPYFPSLASPFEEI